MGVARLWLKGSLQRRPDAADDMRIPQLPIIWMGALPPIFHQPIEGIGAAEIGIGAEAAA
jgi:hypothetical protein